MRFNEDLDILDELETLIEDIALDNVVLPKCHKPLKAISKRIEYPAHEIRTRTSMLWVYYIKERRTGKIIILGHIKGNEKDQNRELNRVVRLVNEYHKFKLRNRIKIIE